MTHILLPPLFLNQAQTPPQAIAAGFVVCPGEGDFFGPAGLGGPVIGV